MAFRFVRGLVGTQVSQLGRLFGIVEQQAMSPLRLVVQQVLGGVWKGQGANAFVEEVSKISIPGIGQVGQHLTTMSQKLRFAEETIDRADEAAGRLVKDRIHTRFKFY
jgi:uncharacterized protein YukE